MTDCVLHPGNESVARCDDCFAPMCPDCCFKIEDKEICPGCIQEECLEMYTEALRIYLKVKKELWIILVGVIIAALCLFTGGAIVSYLICCIPSLLVLGKKAIRLMAEAGILHSMKTDLKGCAKLDEGAAAGFAMTMLLVAFIIGMCVILAPLVAIWRLIQRFIDLSKMKKIIAEASEMIGNYRGITDQVEFDQNGVVVMKNATSLESTGEDEEFKVDMSRMAEFITSDTGEIIRKIDRR